MRGCGLTKQLEGASATWAHLRAERSAELITYPVGAPRFVASRRPRDGPVWRWTLPQNARSREDLDRDGRNRSSDGVHLVRMAGMARGCRSRLRERLAAHRLKPPRIVRISR